MFINMGLFNKPAKSGVPPPPPRPAPKDPRRDPRSGIPPAPAAELCEELGVAFSGSGFCSRYFLLAVSNPRFMTYNLINQSFEKKMGEKVHQFVRLHIATHVGKPP